VSPRGPSRRTEVEVDGRLLSLANLDKVMYPVSGFTKGEVIDYYLRVAPVMVPHLAGRPITLKRYPDGVEGESFYEKNCPSHRPPWVSTVTVTGPGRSDRRGADTVSYCLLDSPAHLVWTANLAALELHPGLAVAADLERPTCVVFDLDPGAPADVLSCGRVALVLRDLFEHLGLVSVVKTSGSKGLQVYLPLNTPTSFDRTRDFALAVGQLLEREHPEDVTTVMNKELRVRKVFLDWSQNVASKTTIAAYSLRALERPTVSTPLEWHEVEVAVSARDPAALRFEAGDVLERVVREGDLFSAMFSAEQELPA